VRLRLAGRLLAAGSTLLAACATGEYHLDGPRSAAGVELAPYAMHEECVALDNGERFQYYFSSVAPVAFNIHYHEGNAVILPLQREKVTQDSGDFTADRKQVYCLTWEAGAQPSVLEYRIRPLPRAR
jgi:hypothetical protein